MNYNQVEPTSIKPVLNNVSNQITAIYSSILESSNLLEEFYGRLGIVVPQKLKDDNMIATNMIAQFTQSLYHLEKLTERLNSMSKSLSKIS